MPFPDSVFDPSLAATIADARRRAALSDAELASGRETRPFRSPEDWRDLSMYFLMVDRFNNPAVPPATRWNAKATFRQGGTLKGVSDRLAYLRDLGMQSLWISPVVRNSASLALLTYHGYSAQNFLSPDERFASDGNPETAGRELAELVASAHDLGIHVILDIVLNHCGDVFSYNFSGSIVDDFADQSLLDQAHGGGTLPGVAWKDGFGNAHPEWHDQLMPGQATGRDDAVRPLELRDTLFFRRRGDKTTDDLSRYPQLGFVPGDFGNMRQMAVEYQANDSDPRLAIGRFPVLTLLLRIYQYWVARYDFDGLRIDTVKYIDPKFIQRFGTAMNEFAYSIGKKNFFIFGEVADNNANIAAFVGRNGPAGEDAPEGGFGIDAALDFPLDGAIRAVATGLFESRAPVNIIRDLFDERRGEEDELISTHGDASAYFVTFVDNHDRHQRIRAPGSPDAEVRLCLALPYLLPGIPCLYYGDEQDLAGTVDDRGNPTLDSFESVREALWGMFPAPGAAFREGGGTYQMLKALSALRAGSGPLKYGRYYFRQVSGDGRNFGWSMDVGGVLAFSRIHADEEVLIVCTPHPFQGWAGFVVIDPSLTPAGAAWRVAFSTLGQGGNGVAQSFGGGGLGRSVPVNLASNELQVLTRV